MGNIQVKSRPFSPTSFDRGIRIKVNFLGPFHDRTGVRDRPANGVEEPEMN